MTGKGHVGVQHGAIFGAKRVAQLVALALVVAAILAILVIPSYESVTTDSSGHETVTVSNVLSVNGLGVLAVLAIPFAISAIPMLVRGRAWNTVSIVAAVLLGVFAAIAALSLGLFFVPALIAEIVAACIPSRPRRGDVAERIAA